MLLNYVDEGPGPVVVLIHGFPLDHTMWHAQLGTLGSIYRVIAPDLRGHGQTAAPEGIYPIDEMADDVIELLDALKISEPVVIGGLSMGGYVALSIAVRHAKRLRGLMLLNTRAAADSPETARVREDLAQEIDRTGRIDAVVASMLPKLFGNATRATRPEIISQMKDTMMSTPARGVAGALRGMAVRPDRRADLARIKIPTLVVGSPGDEIISWEETQSLAEAIPSASLVSIPESGHLTPLENPGATNAAILRFMGSLA